MGENADMIVGLAFALVFFLGFWAGLNAQPTIERDSKGRFVRK